MKLKSGMMVVGMTLCYAAFCCRLAKVYLRQHFDATSGWRGMCQAFALSDPQMTAVAKECQRSSSQEQIRDRRASSSLELHNSR